MRGALRDREHLTGQMSRLGPIWLKGLRAEAVGQLHTKHLLDTVETIDV